MTGLREQKKRRTRLSLATAAVELLICEGDEGATVAAIAARAGVSTRTFHNYFAAREDAFLFFLEETIADWVDKVRAAPADRTPFEALRDVLVEMYTRPDHDIAAAPNLVTIAEHVAAGLGPDSRERGRTMFDGLRTALVGRSGGTLTPFLAQTLIGVCLAACGGVLDAARDPELAQGVGVAEGGDDAFAYVAAGAAD